MKRIITIVALLATLSTTIWAKPVTKDQARRVAVTYMRGIGCRNADNLTDRSAELPYRQFYLFAAEKGGFVLVAADDCVTPILASSVAGSFVTKDMPAHVADWLSGYEKQIAFYAGQEQQESGLHESQSPDPSMEEHQWQMLLAGKMPPAVHNTVVQALMTTTWNQSPYYNSLCPVDSRSTSGRVPVGCTAIATAQVMKYWNYPTTGYGSYSYTHSTYGTQNANFGTTTYNWSSMPNSLSSSSSTAQVNAVATLTYHVSVALATNYGTNTSTANAPNFGSITSPSSENALRYHFKYKPTLHTICRTDYAPAVFDSLLTNELIHSRPIIFIGFDTAAGHAFVLDGVNNSGNYHVNWGWGGYCDGYYAIGSLNPSSGGTGGNTSGTYNLNNRAIIGIQPNTSFGGTTTTVCASSSSLTMGSVSGPATASFGDTVNITANALPGHRFTQWNDGYKYNPRTFIATGGSDTIVANFEMLSGDTMGYATTSTQLTNFGGSNNAYWGIKFPPAVVTASRKLQAVQLFVTSAGSYTVSVYVGSTRGRAAATQTFTATGSEVNRWKTIALDNLVSTNGSQNLWITFHNTGIAYPAALTYSSGNNDGMLWGSSFQSIHNSWHYTFMIRGIFCTRHTATVNCTGTGSGRTERTTLPNTDLCGQSELVSPDSVVTYKLIPSDHTELTHLYVNGADHISEVQADSTGSGFLWNHTFDSSATINPVFDLKTFAISASSADTTQGSATGTGDYAYGQQATLTAVPATGYHFDHWNITTGGNETSSYQNPYRFTVTDSLTATAYFELDSFTISAFSADTTQGLVTGAGNYTYGQQATLTAIPAAGYHFDHWNITTGGNDTISHQNPYTFTVTCNLEASAYFATEAGINNVRSTEVSVYPNPTTGLLLVEAAGIESIQVYNQTGHLVSSCVNTNEINFSDLPSGVYTLQIHTQNGVAVSKVVKQ